MNSQTQELEIVDEIPQDLRMAVVADAPDFEEILLERKKLLAKVEKFEGVESVDDTPRMADAKRLRLDLVKCRTGMDRIRKEVGAKWRRRWESINEMFRPLIAENESAEEFLKESEEFAIRYEASRRAELTAERAPQLQALGVDPSMYNLGEMTDFQWQITLEGSKMAKEKADKELREQQEREKAEREERDRLRWENEKLMEEQRRKDAEAFLERQELQKKAQADAEKANAKIAEERRQREALERKEQERLAEEKRKQDEARKAEAKAKRAPDKQKITLIADDLERSLTQLPAMKTSEGTALAKWIATEGQKFVALIRSKAENL